MPFDNSLSGFVPPTGHEFLMALQTTQNFGSPVKGINRAVSRSNQPTDTAWDMLNIFPFDGSGRIRCAKRRGTSKVWAAALGVATDSIVLLDQITLVTSAGSVSTPILTEPFTYSNGELNASSLGVWNQFENPFGTYILSTSLQIASNKVSDASGDNVIRAMLLDTPPTIDLEAGYSVEASLSISNTNQSQVGLYLEVSDAAPQLPGFLATVSSDGAIFTLTFYPDTTTFTDGTDSHSGVATGVVADTPFTLKVVASAGTGTSRTATVFINDVQIGGFDCPMSAMDARYNFAIVTEDAGTGNFIDDFVVSSVVASGSNSRQTYIVAVANRDVYLGTLATQGTLVTGGEDAIVKSVIPQGCYSAGKYYFVDSGDIKQLDIATATMEAYTETAGTAPTGVTTCCIWRDRLVVAGPDQNVYFSRVGDQHDWDYGQTDPGAAFSANASTAGHIGEPVVSLMPLSDDLLGIGGDHNLWVVRGDPADGGSIDEISNALGVFGARSWTKAPDGTVYFVGTGGLYRWAPNSKSPVPECISLGSYNQFFTALDRSRVVPSLSWDRDKHGMYGFFYRTGDNLEGSPVHLWYDERLDALFPFQLPLAQGPIVSLVYDGDLPNDRVVLLGGRDGYLRQIDDGTLSDDGSAINGRFTIGAFQLGDANNEGIIGRVQLTLGEPDGSFTAADFSVLVTVKAGETAYDVTEGSNAAFYTMAARLYDGEYGRVTPIRERLRGNYGSITLQDNSANKTFGFELATVDTTAAGLTKRRR